MPGALERRHVMSRYGVTSAVAIAVMTGSAAAQIVYPGTTSQTTTTTTVPGYVAPAPIYPAPVVVAPVNPPPGYAVSKTERTVQGNGTVIDQTQSYRNGPGGTSTMTTTRTVAPDGSQSTSWREEWTGTQPAAATVTRHPAPTTAQHTPYDV